MMRNVLLFLVTAALLAIGFVGYYRLTQIQPAARPQANRELTTLEDHVSVADDEVIKVPVATGGTAELPPGGRLEFTVFDEFTGKPKQRLRCMRWTKVPGTRNDIDVVEPQMTLYLPDGSVVDISADAGRLAADQVDAKRLQPKRGHLRGDVRLRVDRPGSPGDGADSLPRIEITLDVLQFDLELGQVRADGALRVHGPEFEIRGEGLELTWNEADKRVEALTIHRGERLDLTLTGDMLSGLVAGRDEGTTSQPTSARVVRAPRRLTTYSCVLDGGVRITHRKGEQTVGTLSAAQLRLLFDLGGDAGRTLSRGRADAAAPPHTDATPDDPAVERAPATSRPADTQPASQPAAIPERLIVEWHGPLNLVPVQSRVTAEPAQRRIEARGGDVRITLADGSTVDCGRLDYHEQTRRLWVYAREGGTVDLNLRDRLATSAESIYFDAGANQIKLIGDIRLMSAAAAGKRGDRFDIRCGLWAVLHLRPRQAGVEQAGALAVSFQDSGALDRAVFVGRVRVDVSGRRLSAQRLETVFRTPQPPAATRPAVAASRPRATGDLQLAAAEASGEVRLEAGSQRLGCTWMRVRFEQGVDGQTQPREVVARGAVWLHDPERDVSIRGRVLDAALTPGGQLEQGIVAGDRQRPAVAHARDYTIAGLQIELTLEPGAEDRAGGPPFHLRVPGRSRLTFVTRRSLAGQARPTATRVSVTSDELMQFDSDAKYNQVRFVGQVVVRNRNDRLEARELTLYLRDVIVGEAAASAGGPGRLLRSLPTTMRVGAALVRLALRAEATLGGSSRALFARQPADRRRIHKEPLRLVAQQAALISETYDPQTHRAVVMQRIDAPELTVEIPQRTVRTIGPTTLGMTSLRLERGEASQDRSAALGLPSGLISRGPSQTVLTAGRSMTYVYGEDGPDRKDSVLFEGGIRFVHVAGRQMKYLDRLLPELARDPEQIKQLKDRKTFLTCDAMELLLDVSQQEGVPRSPRLAWMNARGRVQLIDRQGAGVREVTAGQIEFDRAESTVRVLGDKVMNLPAKIETWNAEKNTYEKPAVGPAFVIHLDTNTVRAERVSGQLRR